MSCFPKKIALVPLSGLIHWPPPETSQNAGLRPGTAEGPLTLVTSTLIAQEVSPRGETQGKVKNRVSGRQVTMDLPKRKESLPSSRL